MKLTKEQIKKFEGRLLELKNQYTHFVTDSSSNVKGSDLGKIVSQHHADVGTDDFDRTINIEVTIKELDILKQVNRALEKIDDGTYGVCDLTGDDIAIKRLEAIPYASTTRDAQEKFEKGFFA